MNTYLSLGELKDFFHASPHYFRPETLLLERPKDLRNFPASGPWVYLTDRAAVHGTIEHRAREENWFVFRCKPRTKVYSGDCNDLVCKRVEVLECVGFAGDFPGSSSLWVRGLECPSPRWDAVFEYPN